MVVNADFRVVNISQGGILLRRDGTLDECPATARTGKVIDLEIQFHDGEIVGVEVTITRCLYNRQLHAVLLAGIVHKGLSPARISKEEAYLLRTVPDFCRADWSASRPVSQR